MIRKRDEENEDEEKGGWRKRTKVEVFNVIVALLNTYRMVH